MYHNRLSDFIHDGFAADPVTFKETFEVRNELETAVVYRIRPKWNFKELHTDWSRLGGDDKDWKGVSWLEIKTEVMNGGPYRKTSEWYKKLKKKGKNLLKELK